jgi:sugar O-acyltransferase (sialic acid O-acetyltransferase NeuD family)
MTSDGVLLVGASGLAREVLAAGMSGVVGVLDDNVALQGTEIAGVPIVGGVAAAADRSERLLICIGPGAGRRRVARQLARLGVCDGRYASFVAPSARLGLTSTIGAGSVVLDGAVVTADAALGRHVVVMPNCTITHDDVLADFATLAAGAALAGGVHLGEAAYIGMNVSVRQGLRVGSDATIGMGAVVLEDVPAGQTWAGVPARRIGVSE